MISIGNHDRGEPDVSFDFDHDVGAPRKARAAIRSLISAADDPIAFEVEAVTSELVSNVIQHTEGGGMLRAWDPTPNVPLRLEVTDRGAGLPEPTPHAKPTEMGGQGLWIVDRMADAWGVVLEPGTKMVWAEFVRTTRRRT